MLLKVFDVFSFYIPQVFFILFVFMYMFIFLVSFLNMIFRSSCFNVFNVKASPFGGFITAILARH